MKKFKLLLMFIFIASVTSSCKKEIDYKPEITNFLQRWAVSIRDRNYQDYSNMVKYVKSEAQFNEKYEYYYLQQPVILNLKKFHDEGNVQRFRINVSFYGMDRVKKAKSSDINGILVIEKKDNIYKIDEQIFIDNTYN